jgi:hypothetical protein
MTMTDGLASRSIDVPGARLHYEVRGSGPVLLVIGSPMAAAEFAPLAHAMAFDHTVVTYDPRGFAGSPVEDPDGPSNPELRADDVAAILDDLDVAHEPPLLELLEDADAQRAATVDIVETFRTDGFHAAWLKFMLNAGFDIGGGDGAAPDGKGAPVPTDTELAEAARFFVHDLVPTTRYVPDFDVLRASASRVVIGLGADSGHLVTNRTSIAVADRLGLDTTAFPGDHGGFLGAPGEFANRLREVLGH